MRSTKQKARRRPEPKGSVVFRSNSFKCPKKTRVFNILMLSNASHDIIKDEDVYHKSSKAFVNGQAAPVSNDPKQSFLVQRSERARAEHNGTCDVSMLSLRSPWARTTKANFCWAFRRVLCASQHHRIAISRDFFIFVYVIGWKNFITLLSGEKRRVERQEEDAEQRFLLSNLTFRLCKNLRRDVKCKFRFQLQLEIGIRSNTSAN